MSTSTITSKGQTTIPARIRDFLKLSAGDRLEFIIQDDGRVFLLPATIDVTELYGMLPRPKKAFSIEEINEVIRKRGGTL